VKRRKCRREGYFVDNSIDRYSLNSYVLGCGKLHTEDGKPVIYVQHDERTDPRPAIWRDDQDIAYEKTIHLGDCDRIGGLREFRRAAEGGRTQFWIPGGLLVDHARPGALRLRPAISGVAAEGEGLAPYQYVPIAFVATMAKRAVAGTPQRTFMVAESELLDSVTGELLAQRVKVGTGTGAKLQEVAGKEQITLQTVKPLLDELAAVSLPNLEKVIRPKAG